MNIKLYLKLKLIEKDVGNKCSKHNNRQYYRCTRCTGGDFYPCRGCSVFLLDKGILLSHLEKAHCIGEFELAVLEAAAEAERKI